MRPLAFAIFIIVAASFSVTRASAQEIDPTLCTADNSDQRLAGCTALIAANQGTPQQVSSASGRRS
jgi:hypothetical protein